MIYQITVILPDSPNNPEPFMQIKAKSMKEASDQFIRQMVANETELDEDIEVRIYPIQ